VTINQPHDTLRDVVAAYRDAGGQGELTIQVHVSWDLDGFGEHVLPRLEVTAPGPAVAADPPGPDGPRRPQQTPQPAVLP